jgi:hypothetical protein
VSDRTRITLVLTTGERQMLDRALLYAAGAGKFFQRPGGDALRRELRRKVQAARAKEWPLLGWRKQAAAIREAAAREGREEKR